MTREENAALAEWLRLVNSAQYFAAHEVLEGPWLRSVEPLRTFLKGLIHVAVALVHYQRGNAHGARVKSRSAQRYLEPYAPGFAGINVADLLGQLTDQFGPLDDLPPGIPLPVPVRTLHVVRDPTSSTGDGT